MKKWLKSIWKKIVAFITGESESGDQPGSFDYKRLHWCYGGENGSGAVEDRSDAGYSINSAKVSSRGITFSGTGRMWNYTHDKADARNCIFFEESGEWYGGFWEWGSVDRTYRGFENIRDGYKGWRWDRFDKSRRILFFVMTKNGSKRSNLIFVDK